METEQAREEQVTPHATEFTTFDLLANESRLEDQGEVEDIEHEPAEIGESRAIEAKRGRGHPKLVRSGEKGRPRKVYPAQYVQPEEEGRVHREGEDEERRDETNLVLDELIGPAWKKAVTSRYAQE